jgi:hypothetical protein
MLMLAQRHHGLRQQAVWPAVEARSRNDKYEEVRISLLGLAHHTLEQALNRTSLVGCTNNAHPFRQNIDEPWSCLGHVLLHPWFLSSASDWMKWADEERCMVLVIVLRLYFEDQLNYSICELIKWNSPLVIGVIIGMFTDDLFSADRVDLRRQVTSS